MSRDMILLRARGTFRHLAAVVAVSRTPDSPEAPAAGLLEENAAAVPEYFRSLRGADWSVVTTWKSAAFWMEDGAVALGALHALIVATMADIQFFLGDTRVDVWRFMVDSGWLGELEAYLVAVAEGVDYTPQDFVYSERLADMILAATSDGSSPAAP